MHTHVMIPFPSPSLSSLPLLPPPPPSPSSLPFLPPSPPSPQLPRNEKVMEAKGSPMSTKKVKTERGESRYGPAKKVHLFTRTLTHINMCTHISLTQCHINMCTHISLTQCHINMCTVSTGQKASCRSSG